jgi:hypothetical protein
MVMIVGSVLGLGVEVLLLSASLVSSGVDIVYLWASVAFLGEGTRVPNGLEIVVAVYLLV